jgi:hypothetical protein
MKHKETCDGCGAKRAIHVANRCSDKLPRVSTERHSRHDRRYAASLRPGSLCRKKLTVDFDGGNQSSDAGLLLLREAERKLGVCRLLAEAMPDRRDRDRIRYAMFEMVMARVSAIACGHKDAIDLDRLRHDPLMKLAVGRCPDSGAALASQSTISRLENAPSKTEAARLGAALLDQFGAAVKPGRLEEKTRNGSKLRIWGSGVRISSGALPSDISDLAEHLATLATAIGDRCRMPGVSAHRSLQACGARRALRRRRRDG